MGHARIYESPAERRARISKDRRQRKAAAICEREYRALIRALQAVVPEGQRTLEALLKAAAILHEHGIFREAGRAGLTPRANGRHPATPPPSRAEP